MSDQSLSAVIRDADWGVIAYVELGRIHPGVLSGVVAESGKPKHVFLPGESSPISHVFFSKTELIKGETVHLVDIANDGWKLFVGDSVFSKAGIPQVEITAEIDRLWERSGHGTERIDIVNAFMAGMANAEKRRVLAERLSPYSHQIDVYRARIDMLIGKAKQPKLPI